MSQDSFNCRSTLDVDGTEYDYFSLPTAEAAGLGAISRLPMSLKILMENLLRFEDGNSVKVADIEALARLFVRDACKRNGLDKRSLDKDALATLRSGRPWARLR